MLCVVMPDHREHTLGYSLLLTLYILIVVVLVFWDKAQWEEKMFDVQQRFGENIQKKSLSLSCNKTSESYKNCQMQFLSFISFP